MERSSLERQPLLSPPVDEDLHVVESTADNGESFDNVPAERRQMGFISTAFMILNRSVGAGIFAVPATVLRSAGSVGGSLSMWLGGALLASAGTAFYLELGAALPRSGGEKLYLEYIYRRPKFFITCIFAVYALLNGWTSANAVAFGEYFLHALNIQATTTRVRLIAFANLTFCFVLHSTKLVWGLRLQNALGFIKLAVLVFMAATGILFLLGVPGLKLYDGVDPPHNFESGHFWVGGQLAVSPLLIGVTNVMWCFTGYSSISFVLSEVKDPIRTIKRAAPLAVSMIAVLYMLINIAYFGVISKEDILGGGRIVGALYFRNLFGPGTERLVSAIIACSTLGNCLAVMFAHSRAVQELGREGVLPFSAQFASNWPFGAPMWSIMSQWLVSSLIVLIPPPGDAYLFLMNLVGYPTVMYNTLLAGGLLLIRLGYSPLSKEWCSPFQTPIWVICIFFASSIFFVLAPLVKPPSYFHVYDRLPYWLHVPGSLVMALIGVIYWYAWFRWLPRRDGYFWERQHVLQEDGVSREVFRKVSS